MRKLFVATASALLLGFSATTVSALPISTADANYLGSVDPGTPGADAQDLIFINYLITLAPGTSQTNVDLPPANPSYLYAVSRSSNAFASLPAAVLAGSTGLETGGPITINTTGYFYLLGKFGDTAHVWVLGGTADSIELPEQLGRGGNGLSNYSLFNATSVPDGGATLSLLAFAALALASVRKWVA